MAVSPLPHRFTEVRKRSLMSLRATGTVTCFPGRWGWLALALRWFALVCAGSCKLQEFCKLIVQPMAA